MDEIPFGHDFFSLLKKKVSKGFSDELQPVPKFWRSQTASPSFLTTPSYCLAPPKKKKKGGENVSADLKIQFLRSDNYSESSFY